MLDLESLAEILEKSKRIVFLTGAGISVSGGIPDFRSNNGLYNLVKTKYPDIVIKGSELFDASLFKSRLTTCLFYTFCGELKQICSSASPTLTHQFISLCQVRGKLLRCYTQNIDGLESRVGLVLDGSNPKVVQLHGDLDTLVCTLCSFNCSFCPKSQRIFSSGDCPKCPRCTTMNENRVLNGKREISIGTLRPNIVLYNEHHRKGDQIAQMQQGDHKKNPDLLFVIGTSLKIAGVKQMIRDFAKQVRKRNGKLVFINLTPPPKDMVENFDIFVQMECDLAIKKLIQSWDKIILQKKANADRRAKNALKKQEQGVDKNTRPITDYLKSVKKITIKFDEKTNKSKSTKKLIKEDEKEVVLLETTISAN